tara:strand:- start:289 stop:540 length:252 start_codon:yes stop_codon:yes gene_type:complete
MTCKFCETASTEYWFSNFCSNCRKIKNLANVYGFDRVLTILEKCCIRDENQLENKIKNHKQLDEKIGDETYASKVTTRSSKKV